MGKKRKAEDDIDAERNLYTSFVSAANNVSQLYTHAVQQQRKIGAAAARQSLERVICYILKEYQHTDVIPKAALLQHLQQEYEYAEGSEHAPQQFPAQFLQPVAQGVVRAHGLPTIQTAPSPARRAHVHASASHGLAHHHACAPSPSAAAAMDTADLYTSMDASTGAPSQQH